MRNTDEIMAGAGFIPAPVVAAALGKSLSTVHRMVAIGKWIGQRDGRALFVSRASLLNYYATNAALRAAVEGL